MTLSELIDQQTSIAEDHGDDDPEVVVAYQPNWPMEVAITNIVEIDPLADFEEEFGDKPGPYESHEDLDQWYTQRELAENQPKSVIIGTAWSNEYLRSGGATALGWR